MSCHHRVGRRLAAAHAIGNADATVHGVREREPAQRAAARRSISATRSRCPILYCGVARYRATRSSSARTVVTSASS
jgi:hypothetical protein